MSYNLLSPAVAPPPFVAFDKIARLSREIIITEKIDGTNASVWISEDCRTMYAGSRTRWISPEDDNAGFAKWVALNAQELLKLGPGQHFGEWWGKGIQRGYGVEDKRFSLFNVSRWVGDACPKCCSTVPVLYIGPCKEEAIARALDALGLGGSHAAPGFMNPEGIVMYHTAANMCFKKTLEKDDEPKGRDAQAVTKLAQ